MDLLEFSQINKNDYMRHPWEIVRAKFLSYLFKKYISSKNITQGDVILDIGCGDAFITKALAKQYPSYLFIGIDPGFRDDTVKKDFKENLPNLEIVSSIHDIGWRRKEKVKAVLLLDLLEHIEEDYFFLSETIDAHLPHNKPLKYIITVPAFPCLFSHHDYVLKHYRRYSLSGIISLAKRTHLSVLEAGYFFSMPLFFRVIEMMMIKLSVLSPKNQTRIASHNIFPFLNPIMQKAMIADLALSRYLRCLHIEMPGLSCYLISEKPSS